MLREGVGWQIGNGVSISTFYHDWIPSLPHSQLVKIVNNNHLESVANLIDSDLR